GTLDLHMQKEERILFPALRAGRVEGIVAPLAAMRADHDGHAADTAAILALTGDLAPPDGACRTWRALYDGLRAFLADLEAHIRLENEVLFPRFESALSAPDAGRPDLGR
ncbi:hemerythrin domain-containing protein, partial [Defluviimonas salinarum]